MEKARKAAFVPIWIIIGNIFHSFYSRLTPWKTCLYECWCRYKKKVCFNHPFWYEGRQERGNHEPLVSLRRPGSAEQAQLFSVIPSNGGKCETSARVSHAREEWKKKPRKTPVTLCTPRWKNRKKTFWEYWIAREVMIWIKILQKKC